MSIAIALDFGGGSDGTKFAFFFKEELLVFGEERVEYFLLVFWLGAPGWGGLGAGCLFVFFLRVLFSERDCVWLFCFLFGLRLFEIRVVPRPLCACGDFLFFHDCGRSCWFWLGDLFTSGLRALRAQL